MRNWPIFHNPPRLISRGWALGSAAVHALLLAWLLSLAGQPAGKVVSFTDPAEGRPERPYVTYLMPVEDGGPAPVAGGGGSGGGAGDAEPAPVEAPTEAPEGVSAEPTVVTLDPAAATTQSRTGRGPRRSLTDPGGRRLGPDFGDGIPWVEVQDTVAIPGAVLATLPGIDSLLMTRLRDMVNNLPPDSFAMPEKPTWTTEAGGKTWGIDDKFIYLGDIKIPTAVLALLPLDYGGDYFRDQERAQLERMRQDLIRVARRQADMADFRQYVEETRRRKDRERAEQARPRVVARDTIKP